MDRNAIASLTRPRHLAATVAVFLGLGGFAGFVVGAASATDETSLEGTPLTTFSLPMPFVGDAGRYEVRSTDPDETGPVDDHGVKAIDFHWYDDQVLRDDQGVARWANVVRIIVDETRGDEPYVDDETIAFRPGTPDGFAILRVDEDAEATEDFDRSTVSSQVSFIDRDNTLPCLFRNAFQGQALDIPTGTLPSPPYCRVGARFYMGSGDHLVGLRAAEKDGVRYLLAQVGSMGGLFSGGEGATFLFRDDIPYPIQMRLFGDDVAYVLTGFQRGTTQALAEDREVAPAPAPLTMAPLTAWGPEEGNVAHTFPASEAYDRLLQQPETGLAAFLDEHPGAYVAEVYYQNLTSNGQDGHWNSWSFSVTDGIEVLRTYIRRIDGMTTTTTTTAGPILGPLGLTDPTATTAPAAPEYDWQEGQVEDAAGRYPIPSSIPEVPTVESMLAQWTAYAPQEFQGKPGNAWRLSLSCVWTGEVMDCSQAQANVAAGYERYDRVYDETDPTAEPRDTAVSSMLYWYSVPGRDDLTFEHPYFYSDQRTDWRRPGQDAAPVDDGPRYDTHSAGLLGIGVWSFPAAKESAAIGLGAFLAASAYFLWPVVKGGGLGLFSRVQKDRLLDNPLRQQLVQRIEAEPGVHHNALVRGLGKGKGAAEHHLEKLVASRLVLRHRSPGYTCYFPVGTDHRLMAAGPALKADGARRILEALHNGVTGVRAIAVITDLAPSTVSHHLERLRAAGLVVGDGHTGFRPAAGRSDAGLAAA